MPKCYVVADDLTGANATGVLLRQNGLKVCTLWNPALRSALNGWDCLMLSTNSRALPAPAAYQAVTAALQGLHPQALYAKRIDSTLRGNLGAEADALLDHLGDDTLALCAPCYPQSGRVLVGGLLLVGGVPLDRTEAGRDPSCPMDTAQAALILKRQSKRPVASLCLDDLKQAPEQLAQTLRSFHAAGARLVVADGVCQEDLEQLALAAKASQLPILPMDPGPFTACWFRQMLPVPAKTRRAKVLCAIGSVNDVARRQAAHLIRSVSLFETRLDVAQLVAGRDRFEQECDRAAQALIKAAGDYDCLAVIGSSIDPARQVPIPKENPFLSQRISDGFAQVALAVMGADERFRGLYSTGGDITCAIHDRAGTAGLCLLNQVLPLACYGRVLGGRLDGRHFVSKGGMVGEENAMTACVTYLADHLQEGGDGC
ncbi:MAG: four-carbon acid sugar kinase family protein [Clostridia bacterium]|nr:four-carbon acid sugar kinase family protein [Clostridia bacterium]